MAECLEIPDQLITQRSGFIHMYGDSLKEALKATFPELNFDFKGIPCAHTARGDNHDYSEHKPRGYWNNIENRRRFFQEFAAERGFDPLQAENWATITPAQVHKKVQDHTCTRKLTEQSTGLGSAECV